MYSTTKIGQVNIPGLLALGPMAGVTDPPFRILCKEQGADLLYTEMVSAKGYHYNNKNTEALLFTAPVEHPVALQLFGEDPEIMAETAKRIEELPFDILDINMGCPVPKVVNNGEGSALMKNPEKIGRIVEAVSKATVKPVTVKIRKGFSDDCINAPECAYIAQESGAKAVAVHGRTRMQFYSGKADWGIIRAVKDKVKIPVIGNGDVDSPETALKMFYETGCDMVMIGRAARGNPWIFAKIRAALDCFLLGTTPAGRAETSAHPGKTYDMSAICKAGERLCNGATLEEVCGGQFSFTTPSFSEIRETVLRHARDLIDFKGEQTAISEMRQYVCHYTAGMPGSARLRGELVKIVTYEDLKRVFPK